MASLLTVEKLHSNRNHGGQKHHTATGYLRHPATMDSDTIEYHIQPEDVLSSRAKRRLLKASTGPKSLVTQVKGKRYGRISFSNII